MSVGSDPLNAASTPEVCDGDDDDLNEGIDEGYPNNDYDGDTILDCADSDTLVVNSTGDPGDGPCTLAECTLREAITAANSLAGPDNIVFNIAPAGAKTIAPASALPVVSEALIIDGTTQPGFANCASGPIVGLDGCGAGAGANGVEISAGSSIVRGLVINSFQGNGILLETGGANSVECNYVGAQPDGTTAAGNGGDGVRIDALCRKYDRWSDIRSGEPDRVQRCARRTRRRRDRHRERDQAQFTAFECSAWHRDQQRRKRRAGPAADR